MVEQVKDKDEIRTRVLQLCTEGISDLVAERFKTLLKVSESFTLCCVHTALPNKLVFRVL